MSICIINKLYFKESYEKEGNNVVELPPYLQSLFDNEYSPIKTYLQTINPNKTIILTIDLEVIEDV